MTEQLLPVPLDPVAIPIAPVVRRRRPAPGGAGTQPPADGPPARAPSTLAVRWWGALSSLEAAMLGGSSFDALLREALATIGRALSARSVALLVVDEAAGDFVVRAATGIGRGGRVGLHIGDVRSSEADTRSLAAQRLGAGATVPVRSGARLLGMLHAASRRPDPFTPAQRGVLELMADRLAGTLDRVRLFEAERAARLAAERSASRLARLQRMTSHLLGAVSVEEVAAVLTESVTSLDWGPGVRQASLWLARDGRLGPVPVATVPDDQAARPATWSVWDATVHAAFRERRPVFLGGDACGTAPGVAGAAGRDAAVLSIVLRAECLGVLVVIHEAPHDFDPDERDVLAAMVDQAALALDRARLDALRAETARVSAYLAKGARVIAEASSFADALDRLADLALPAVGDVCLIDVVDEDGGLTRMVAKHRDRARQHLVEGLRPDFPPDPSGQHPAAVVVRTGRTQWAPAVTDDMLRAMTRSATHLAMVTPLHVRSYVAVPVVSDGEILGSMLLVSTTRSLSLADVSFAERLAEQVAAVVANARRYDVTVRTSHILQHRLLPQRLPDVPGLSVHTRYLTAAHGFEVGGDFFDMVVLPDGSVGLAIGDVAGHDGDAAAMMGHLRSAARALAGQVRTPAELVAALRWSWDLLDFDRIATAAFCRLDPTTGDLTVASAGHYPPLLVEAGRASYLPVVPSPPLGAPSGGVSDWRGTLAAGQVLLLYTDGAVDERTGELEESMARLAAVATEGELTPVALCDRIVATLAADRPDDVALLALRFDP
jgi:serine/threonine-protein kinase RsbW